MTDRERIVSTAQKYIGCKEADGSHKKIIDIYNSREPRPRGYKMSYTDAWCATFVSAMAIECGLTDIIPPECSCGYMIEGFKKLGRWQENDNYKPLPGDVIFYDWQDGGGGDNVGAPDHVGIVEKVSGATVTVIEGNKGNAVARRSIAVNGRYIRGYGLPDYDGAPAATLPGPIVGDAVSFTGCVHYTEANGGIGKSCKAGPATVMAVWPGADHPYHLIAVSGGGATVYGWVKAADVKAAAQFKVGDEVQFLGGPHYASSDASSPIAQPVAGPARVTAVMAGASHPYHLIHTTEASSVWGWVDAEKVSGK